VLSNSRDAKIEPVDQSRQAEAEARTMAHDSEKRTVLSAEKARQGSIVLRRRWQRLLFIGGLVAIVVLVVVLRLAGA
jgi:hypothetical protein